MADAITIKALQDASLDAKTLEEAVNGDAVTTVLSRLGETYPTLSNALNQIDGQISDANDMLVESVTTLFTNGGLPATPFATKALMTASALVDGKYAQVTDDTVNNGLYVKTAGAWVKSAYDPLTQSKSYTDAQKSITLTAAAVNTNNAVSEVVSKNTDNEIIQGFTDKDGKLLAFIDKAGELDFYPTAQTKNRVNVIQENIDSEFLYLLLDADNKIIDGIDKNGDRYPKDKNGDRYPKDKIFIQENDDSDYIYLLLDNDGRMLDGIDKHGNPINSVNQSSTSEIPLKTPLKTIANTVSVKSFNPISQKLALNTTAKGRSTDPDIIVTGNGNTHPKMVYVPQGWNGYTYWLAATPTFGIVGGQAAYENPHVWASNDMVTWVEPSGGRIDEPEDDNSSYWSDTHLVLDDDGWMYCIYRGNWFTFSQRCIVAKRSRDGVRWSDRIMIYNANTDGVDANSGILSPAIYKSGTKWQMIDVLMEGQSFEFTTDYGNGVFRRSANEVVGKYEDYNTDKLVRYNPKQWGDTQQVWHIDALMVGNMHLHLIAVGNRGASMSSELYLAWSQDGWNFKVLPKLDTNASNAYRSSLSVKDINGSDVIFDLLLSRTNGIIDLYELTLEIK